jgi:ketosteroid isomerase-like protein
MYSWIVGRVLRFLIGKLVAGDVDLLMRGFAKDAVLVFPGSSSFGGEQRGHDAIRAWLERFVALRPRFEVHEVAVAGPPWNMRVFFRFTDHIPVGGYENHGAEYLQIRFGQIREQRVYLDTERVTRLDAQLEEAPAVA